MGKQVQKKKRCMFLLEKLTFIVSEKAIIKRENEQFVRQHAYIEKGKMHLYNVAVRFSVYI